MRVTVNGEGRDLAEGTTVADVVRQLAAPPHGIAVARNDQVVPRGDWAGTVLADGDRVEVLTAVQGG